MAESHSAEAHHGPSNAIYWAVFAGLSVFTVVSIVVNLTQRWGALGLEISFLIILTVAVCKASMVGAFFMHLLYDWRTTYFLIVPTMILAALLLIVLWPDMVLAWREVNAMLLKGATGTDIGGH